MYEDLNYYCMTGVGAYYIRSSVSIHPQHTRRPQYELLYYESIKRELKTRPISECRCDERLRTKAEESTHLSDTGLLRELEHLKIKTRLIDEKFASVMGECMRMTEKEKKRKRKRKRKRSLLKRQVRSYMSVTL